MNSRIKKVIIGTTIASSIFSFTISNSFANFTQHKVVAGDTLWKISQQYETSLDELYKINPKFVSNSSLLVGDVVNVPSKVVTYTVKTGDTPWTISNSFGITLQQFMSFNNLKDGQHIYPGNTVIISVGNAIGQSQSNPIVNPIAPSNTYIVQRGDTPWTISNQFGITMNQFLEANGLKDGQHIYPGDRVIIPQKISSNQNNNSNTQSSINYTVKNGDTPWTISNAYKISMNDLLNFNGLTQKDFIYPGQVLKIPSQTQQPQVQNPPIQQNPSIPQSPSTPQKTFITHTVVSGDDLWKISIRYGIPFSEVLQVNGFKENHIVYIGDKIKIPVYNIPVKPTKGDQYGELLDWWTEAQYVVPINKTFKIIDFYSGKAWFAKRTIGANHADCEPLTANDAAIMREVWGGNFSWSRRPVIIEVDGRRLAASVSSFPHDIQYITNNNFNGHFDLYFLNSTRHVDGKGDPEHQKNVLIAAGN